MTSAKLMASSMPGIDPARSVRKELSSSPAASLAFSGFGSTSWAHSGQLSSFATGASSAFCLHALIQISYRCACCPADVCCLPSQHAQDWGALQQSATRCIHQGCGAVRRTDTPFNPENSIFSLSAWQGGGAPWQRGCQSL